MSKWTKAILLAIIIVVLDIIVLYLGTSSKFHIGWSLGSIGIITFFGTLMLINFLSGSSALDKGEMRKSIASSFIAVYFILISLVATGYIASSDTELAKTIVGHFTYLVGIIIVFYFASSSVREYIKMKENKDGSNDQG